MGKINGLFNIFIIRNPHLSLLPLNFLACFIKTAFEITLRKFRISEIAEDIFPSPADYFGNQCLLFLR